MSSSSAVSVASPKACPRADTSTTTFWNAAATASAEPNSSPAEYTLDQVAGPHIAGQPSKQGGLVAPQMVPNHPTNSPVQQPLLVHQQHHYQSPQPSPPPPPQQQVPPPQQQHVQQHEQQHGQQHVQQQQPPLQQKLSQQHDAVFSPTDTRPTSNGAGHMVEQLPAVLPPGFRPVGQHAIAPTARGNTASLLPVTLIVAALTAITCALMSMARCRHEEIRAAKKKSRLRDPSSLVGKLFPTRGYGHVTTDEMDMSEVGSGASTRFTAESSQRGGTKIQFFWDGWEGAKYVGPPWQGKSRVNVGEIESITQLMEQVGAKADALFGQGALPMRQVEMSYRLKSKSKNGEKSGSALLPLSTLAQAQTASVIFVTRSETLSSICNATSDGSGCNSDGNENDIEEHRCIACQPQSWRSESGSNAGSTRSSAVRSQAEYDKGPPLELVLQWGTKADVVCDIDRSLVTSLERVKCIAAQKVSALIGEQVPPSSVRMMTLMQKKGSSDLQLLPVTSLAELVRAKAVQVTKVHRDHSFG
eukprot:CAMPEP_0119348662 /NCGR_PEP_ID=MMETSP1333-20130426/109160_1 /TAXON_ID=418940 /ORGANISM="Scyphosphaera apsteinii, Strain RCC1455" /LENGTH=529 /DNA_ID=CAMNT_0007361253 /DNA_START=408 /DNA_END=1998 /DNA_ORIENTATION=+